MECSAKSGLQCANAGIVAHKFAQPVLVYAYGVSCFACLGGFAMSIL